MLDTVCRKEKWKIGTFCNHVISLNISKNLFQTIAIYKDKKGYNWVRYVEIVFDTQVYVLDYC